MTKKRYFIIFLLVAFLVSPFFAQELSAGQYQYSSKDRRDPFIPLVARGEAQSSVEGLMTVESIEDIKLEGIIYDPSGRSIAVLNGELVKEGQRIHNVEILKIYDKAIRLKLFGTAHTIRLIQEGGEEIER